MITGKPEIFIYSNGGAPDLLGEICAGIEEEGLLYKVVEMAGDVDTLAFGAAADSMLGAGIGICQKTAAMQMRALPVGKNVFKVADSSRMQCRLLGANSARAVKKLPFRQIESEDGI